jgi:hypothetical protein
VPQPHTHAHTLAHSHTHTHTHISLQSKVRPLDDPEGGPLELDAAAVTGVVSK